MNTIATRFGIYSGLSMGILFAVFWVFGMGGDDICKDLENGQIIGYATMILALLIIFPGVKRYRDEELNGSIKFSRALGVGMIITLISAMIFVIFDTVYLFVNRDFFSDYLNCEVEQMNASGRSQEEIDLMISQMEIMTGPMGILLTEIITLVTVCSIGFIISLISAAILKK